VVSYVILFIGLHTVSATLSYLPFTFIVDIFGCLRHRLTTLIVASSERQRPQTQTQNMFESSAFFIGKVVSYYDDQLGCTFTDRLSVLVILTFHDCNGIMAVLKFHACFQVTYKLVISL